MVMDTPMSNGSASRPFFQPAPKGPRGQGRPMLNEPRAILLNRILWILRTGAPWKDLPERYPPYRTCHRWFQRWRKEGAFDVMSLALAENLREHGKLDLREAFIDGEFAPAKKGGVPLVKTSAAKAPKSWQRQMLLVFLSPF